MRAARATWKEKAKPVTAIRKPRFLSRIDEDSSKCHLLCFASLLAHNRATYIDGDTRLNLLKQKETFSHAKVARQMTYRPTKVRRNQSFYTKCIRLQAELPRFLQDLVNLVLVR